MLSAVGSPHYLGANPARDEACHVVLLSPSFDRPVVADDIERLARIAGMLGSAHEDERATAVQMASAMLKTMGLTWTEVINRGLGASTFGVGPCRRAEALQEVG